MKSSIYLKTYHFLSFYYLPGHIRICGHIPCLKCAKSDSNQDM